MKLQEKHTKVISAVLIAAVIICAFIISAIRNRRTPAEAFNGYYIVNNEILQKGTPDFSQDVHKVENNGGGVIYTNYPFGYKLAFPQKAEFDLSASNIMTKAVINGNIDFTVTKEWSPYEDSVKYIEEYTNRYMMDPKYIEENKLDMHKNEMLDIGGYRMQYIIFTRQTPEGGLHDKNTYAHCYLYTNTQRYYRMTFNAYEYNEDFLQLVYYVTQSIDENVTPSGEAGFYLNIEPELPSNWNAETQRTYENIVNRTTPAWGIFRPQSVKDNALWKINSVEEKIDNKFMVALDYMYFGEEVPIAGMQTAYEQGKLVELTMQISTVMHQNSNGYNPFFEVLDGTRDDYIREIAHILRDFEHPFMFRLNNEMNTDWTSYGGACIINEPELFKEVWIHIYEIFEEEGVNNAIWIFNPNDRNCPPNEYNHFMNYYPGNKYAQIFGITGYNTGTYYADVFGEEWREFEEIYDNIYNNCEQYFGKFPWMITEFSSSSVGGDKVEWINNMFEAMPKYDNLKIAVWFCSVDYDFRISLSGGIVARPYLLDETDETAKAFSDGLKKSGYEPKALFAE